MSIFGLWLAQQNSSELIELVDTDQQEMQTAILNRTQPVLDPGNVLERGGPAHEAPASRPDDHLVQHGSLGVGGGLAAGVGLVIVVVVVGPLIKNR